MIPEFLLPVVSGMDLGIEQFHDTHHRAGLLGTLGPVRNRLDVLNHLEHVPSVFSLSVL